MPELDDKALIDLIKSSDSSENDKGFRYMYKEYLGMIQNVVVNNNGDSQDGEDIFQDGMIVLFNQARKPDFELRCTIKTYLYSICRNLWLKKLRKSSRIVELSDTIKQFITVDETQLKTLEVTEEKEIVANYLNQLSNGCQEILKYFYFDKIKMSKIAQLMGLANEQGAKNKKSMCMKKLKSLMKDSKHFK